MKKKINFLYILIIILINSKNTDKNQISGVDIPYQLFEVTCLSEYPFLNGPVKEVYNTLYMKSPLFKYDKKGKLLLKTNLGTEDESIFINYYIYDKDGDLIRIEQSYENEDERYIIKEYTYDDNKNLVKIKSSLKLVQYIYDDNKNLIKVISEHNDDKTISEFNYDNNYLLGKIESNYYNNKLKYKKNYKYNYNNKIIEEKYFNDVKSKLVLAELLKYTYNAGNILIKKKEYNFDIYKNELKDYKIYDYNGNEIIQKTSCFKPNDELEYYINYVYDKYGNLTAEKTYNNKNKLTYESIWINKYKNNQLIETSNYIDNIMYYKKTYKNNKLIYKIIADPDGILYECSYKYDKYGNMIEKNYIYENFGWDLTPYEKSYNNDNKETIKYIITYWE